jgi:gliding-associated putative ABC transporter substrate-binding component GldG
MKNKRILWWIGLLAGIVLINVLASVVHYRVDLTEEKRYSLTATSHNLLRKLEDNILITVFLKGDLPAEFRRLSNSTEDFLSTFREASPGKIRYRFVDPQDQMASGGTWSDSISALGASPINLSVQVKAGQENKIVFPYALVQNGNQSALVNLFPSSKRNITVAELNNAEAMMEYQFAKTIDKLQKPEKTLVAYAIGHGEPTDVTSFSLLHTIDPESVPKESVNPELFDVNAKSNYKLGLFNLKEQKFIPQTFNVLLIVKPSAEFTADEKLKIDQYVMRGGKVLWFIDNLNAEEDSLSMKSQIIAYERGLNIQDLLFNYGVRINPDLVMDLQCGFLPFAVGGSREAPQYEFLHWNYYPLFESRNNHAINKNIGLVSGRYVNSVDTIQTEGLQKTVLLQSSVNSRKITTPALISPNENRNTPEDALFKQANIPSAVLLEGTFTSFFRGRLTRAQRDSLNAIGGFKDKSVESKMIVVGDGDVVLNDVSSQKGPLPMGLNLYTMGTQYEYPFANRDFLLNCLEYLTGNANVIATRNKEIVLRLLDQKKVEEEKTKWQLINIAVPVLLVVLFGFIYQQIRKYRFAK